MSDFKLAFTLRQHTPIIHFQHDQAGATLRATEVKAKLDKYIWEKEWRNDFSKGFKYLTGASGGSAEDLRKRFEKNGYRALAYKLNFSAADAEKKSIPEKFPPYFGNLSNEESEKQEKHFMYAQGVVNGNIFTYFSDLRKILEKHIVQFFQTENFGTRQNKGFGSFQIEMIDGKKPEYQSPSRFYFKLPVSEGSNRDKHLFESIDLFYRSLRSGINLKGANRSDKLYFKSLLFQYAKSKGDQWDKRKIRRDLFHGHPNFIEVEATRTEKDGTVQFNEGTPKLYRDMLGLSSSQSWLSYGKATVMKDAAGIDRFKSPITFKPFLQKKEWLIYIIISSIPDDMKNVTFNIQSGKNKTSLITPDFDIDAYLKFAFGFFKRNGISVDDYVGKNDARREVELLEDIYEQLSEQI